MRNKLSAILLALAVPSCIFPEAHVQGTRRFSPEDQLAATVGILSDCRTQASFDFDPTAMPGPELPVLGTTTSGRGVVISDRQFLTAYHVANCAGDIPRIRVTMHDGSTYRAVFQHWDEDRDLAVLELSSAERIEPTPFAPTLGTVPPVGSAVCLAVGANVGRRCGHVVGTSKNSGDIRTTVVTAPGFSGSPLYDVDGNLVGIHSQASHENGDSEFATSVWSDRAMILKK